MAATTQGSGTTGYPGNRDRASDRPRHEGEAA